MTTILDTLSDLASTMAAQLRSAAAGASSQQTQSSGFAQALASTAQASTAGTPAWQAPWLAGSETAGKYLLTANGDTAANRNAKPSIAAFMSATGTDFDTASSTLYGVIGSNNDLRDWSAIMAADDPLLAARQATGALYASNLDYGSTNSFHPTADQTLASSGNFAWLNVDNSQGLWLMDGKGGALRQLPLSAPDILRAARDFGVDPSKLSGLADQMDAKGLSYQPAGGQSLDLRSLAQGGKGSNTDWTSDPLVSRKGEGAASSLAANIQLARELGVPGTAGTATNTKPAASTATTTAAGSSTATSTAATDANALALELGNQLINQLQAALQDLQTQASNATASKTS